MGAYTIIPASHEHVPFLASVERAAATVFPEGSIPDALREDSVPLSVLAAAVSTGGLWVALDADGRVVGFALLRTVDGIALLAEVDVAPEHARKGVGRRLIAAAAGRAREAGYDALYLTTFSHVAWNMPFYARIGFSVLPEGSAPPALERALLEERARGLAHRVAMRLALG
ncbi:MAG: GNAT family N-acetyltransferase [Deltaproteobacteria bacterium]|nr:GNAT family N-acetyltransferase [Deltaproteobacteria bacterium]